MSGEYQIEVTDIATGQRLSATVKIVRIGGSAVSQIKPSRPPSPSEVEVLERAVEEIVRRGTGGPVSLGSSEICESVADAEAKMRRYFGGGVG